MTNEQHLTTIAEFMGWEYDYDDFLLEESFVRKDPHWPDFYPANSFDTMRMVFDEWRTKKFPLEEYWSRKDYVEKIKEALSNLTPFDCAARLAEAIEWWKTVKS